MALNTYSLIIAGLQAFLEDDNSEFVGSAPDCLNMAERRLAKDLDLSTFHRTQTVTMSIGTNAITKPTPSTGDILLATKAVWLTHASLTRPVFPEKRDYGYCLDYGSIANGLPKYYAELSETQLYFTPAPDVAYVANVRYLSQPAPLSGTVATNWLSTNVPELLFKAALAECEKFLKAEDRSAIWEADYQLTLPATKKAVYQQFGNQYDRIGATPIPQGPRSAAQ